MISQGPQKVLLHKKEIFLAFLWPTLVTSGQFFNSEQLIAGAVPGEVFLFIAIISQH